MSDRYNIVTLTYSDYSVETLRSLAKKRKLNEVSDLCGLLSDYDQKAVNNFHIHYNHYVNGKQYGEKYNLLVNADNLLYGYFEGKQDFGDIIRDHPDQYADPFWSYFEDLNTYTSLTALLYLDWIIYFLDEVNKKVLKL